MDNQKKLSVLPVLFILLITVLWNVVLYFLPRHDTIWNYLFNICYSTLYLYGFLIGLWGARKIGLNTTVGRTLLYLGLGSGSYAIAAYIWVYYNVILDIEVPFPSIADVFFLLLSPFMAVGCWNLLKIIRSQIKFHHVLESLIIFSAASIAIFGFVYKLELTKDMSLVAILINVFYPLSDVILISLAFIVWRTGGGKIKRISTLLVIALLLQTIADVLFTFRTSNELYWNGGPADSAWALSGFVFSIAIIYLINNFVYSNQEKERPL